MISGTAQKEFNLKNVLVIFLVVAGLGVLVWSYMGPYMEKARESEAQTQLSSIYTSEKAFFAEYKRYSASTQELGYTSSEGELRGEIYLGAWQIPREYVNFVPESSLPFATEQEFRAIYIMPDNACGAKLFTINDKKEFKKVELECDKPLFNKFF